MFLRARQTTSSRAHHPPLFFALVAASTSTTTRPTSHRTTLRSSISSRSPTPLGTSIAIKLVGIHAYAHTATSLKVAHPPRHSSRRLFSTMTTTNNDGGQGAPPVQTRTEPKKQASMYDNAQPTGAPHAAAASSAEDNSGGQDVAAAAATNDGPGKEEEQQQAAEAESSNKEAEKAAEERGAAAAGEKSHTAATTAAAGSQAQAQERSSSSDAAAADVQSPPTQGGDAETKKKDSSGSAPAATSAAAAAPQTSDSTPPVQQRTEPKKAASTYDNSQPTGTAEQRASSSSSAAPGAQSGVSPERQEQEEQKDKEAEEKQQSVAASSSSTEAAEADSAPSAGGNGGKEEEQHQQDAASSSSEHKTSSTASQPQQQQPVQQRTEPEKAASTYDNSQPTGEPHASGSSSSANTVAPAAASSSSPELQQQQPRGDTTQTPPTHAAGIEGQAKAPSDSTTSASAQAQKDTSPPVQQRTEPERAASKYDNEQPTGQTGGHSAGISEHSQQQQQQQETRSRSPVQMETTRGGANEAQGSSPSPSPPAGKSQGRASVGGGGGGGGSIRDLIKGFENKAAAAGGAVPSPPSSHAHTASGHVEKGPKPVQERTEPERSASKYDNEQPTGAKSGGGDASASSSSNSSLADDEARIKQLGDAIRQLKLDRQPFEAELKEMAALKAKVGQAAAAASGGGKRGGGKGSDKMTLKTPKGTKDHLPSSTLLRKRIFDTLEGIFQKHGAMTIDTPVFELKEILAGKYGEDSKLIYDLKDQGGEICSLRYDLTVPFARFLAMNQHLYPQMKRYHIGKVYRRDQPALSKGRMREFYQCDYDVAGTFDPMVPDAEVLAVVVEALEALEIGDFTVKINHRKVLDGIFQIAGVPADKTRAISSAVDKLDKAPWAEVKKEMTEEKGLDAAVADRIGEYVKLKGPGKELLAKLQQDPVLTGNAGAKQGLDDMALLFDYLDILGALDRMSFDLSLARGLDYYTGIIYEAVHESSAAPQLAAAQAPAVAQQKKKKVTETEDVDEEIDESTVGVGSIAAGGRYDELVGMFVEASGGKKGSGRIPCVGVSVGVERVYSIMLAKQKERMQDREARGKETEVYVVSMGGNGLLKERMQLAKQLWDAGIKAEFMYKNKPKPNQQLDACDRDQTPFTVIIGPAEVEAQTARVRRQLGKEGGTTEGDPVPRTELVEHLKAKIAEWRATL